MKDTNFDAYFYSALGDIVSEYRNKSNRTFEEVAQLLDIPSRTYYCYERGTRKMPVSIFNKLCLLYQIDKKETLRRIAGEAYKKIEADQNGK